MARKNRIGKAEILGMGMYEGSKGLITITPNDKALADFLKEVERKVGDAKTATEYSKADIVWEYVISTLKYAHEGTEHMQKFDNIYEAARQGSAMFGVRIGTFIESNVGVCREQALLAHIALAHIGIETRFIVGDAPELSSTPNRHAWVEFVNHGSGREMILDPSLGLIFKDIAYNKRKIDTVLQLVKPIKR